MTTTQNTTQNRQTVGQKVAELKADALSAEPLEGDALADARWTLAVLDTRTRDAEDAVAALESARLERLYPVLEGPRRSPCQPVSRLRPTVALVAQTDRALSAALSRNAVALESIADALLDGQDVMSAARAVPAENVSRGLKADRSAEVAAPPLVVTAEDLAAWDADTSTDAYTTA